MIRKIAETLFFSELTLSLQGLSGRALVNPGPAGEEELVNALGHITSHSPPIGFPSFARYANLNFSYTIAEVENTKGMLFNYLNCLYI